MKYKHLFFDLDKTIAPSREPILQDMYDLLLGLQTDIIIVSGQLTNKIAWQSNQLPAIRMGQNGNHAETTDGNLLWYTPLTEQEQQEILEHIRKITELLDEVPNENYVPIENRGAQITFSPIGNQAPVEMKRVYDPDRTIREDLLKKVPFISETLSVMIGGSTSLDYVNKTRCKGANVTRLIEHKSWNKAECVYFGDGLYPGGNDESVIGIIDTIPVRDHLETYEIITREFIS